MEGGATDTHLRGEGDIGGRDNAVSTGGDQGTGKKAGMFPHTKCGAPNGAPGRRRKSDRDDGRMKKNTPLILITRGPDIIFIIFISILKLGFTTQFEAKYFKFNFLHTNYPAEGGDHCNKVTLITRT